MLNKKQAGFSKVIILIIALVVIAGGVLAWQFWPAESPSPARNASRSDADGDNQAGKSTEDVEGREPSVVDETADWQTYRNKEYGFEMKYPAGTLICPYPTGSFAHRLLGIPLDLEWGGKRCLANIWIDVFSNFCQVSTIEEWIETCIESTSISTSSDIANYNNEEFLVGNLSAYSNRRYFPTGGSTVRVYFFVDDKIFVVSYYSETDIASVSTTEEIFRGILSTFQFTE